MIFLPMNNIIKRKFQSIAANLHLVLVFITQRNCSTLARIDLRFIIHFGCLTMTRIAFPLWIFQHFYFYSILVGMSGGIRVQRNFKPKIIWVQQIFKPKKCVRKKLDPKNLWPKKSR